jgi:hypothetical protein
MSILPSTPTMTSTAQGDAQISHSSRTPQRGRAARLATGLSTSPTIPESQAIAARDGTPRRRGVAGVVGVAVLTALLVPAVAGAVPVPHSPGDGIAARPPALQGPVHRCTPMPPTSFAHLHPINVTRVSVPVQRLTHCLGHGLSRFS